MPDPARLLAFADRLGRMSGGSAAADLALHKVLQRAGPVLPYTTEADAARTLMPAGFKELPLTSGAAATYAAVSRSGLLDGLPYPHHGNWGTTYALALAGACLRAHAKIARESGQGAL